MTESRNKLAKPFASGGKDQNVEALIGAMWDQGPSACK